MIARLWHGRVPNAKAPRCREFLAAPAGPDHRSVPGHISVHVLERADGDIAHFVTLTFRESLASIRGFAGDGVEVAKYYPEDRDSSTSPTSSTTRWRASTALPCLLET